MDLSFIYNPCSVLLQGSQGSTIWDSQEDSSFVPLHTQEKMKQSFIFAPMEIWNLDTKGNLDLGKETQQP